MMESPGICRGFLFVGSILVRIELVGSRHRYVNGHKHVQDVDGRAVRYEDLGEALVAVVIHPDHCAS